MKEKEQRRPRGGGSASPENERFECSGAAMVADCVALCCCPCAVVSFVAFALVKVPCLAAEKMRKKIKTKRKMKKKKRKEEYESEGERNDVVSDKKEWWLEEGIMGISKVEESEDERVWWELNQIGYLGFGRLSFTGVQFHSN